MVERDLVWLVWLGCWCGGWDERERAMGEGCWRDGVCVCGLAFILFDLPSVCLYLCDGVSMCVDDSRR